MREEEDVALEDSEDDVGIDDDLLAEEDDDSIVYFVEITATIYGGQEAQESTRQSITWESPGTLGDTPSDAYEQSITDALASEVKEFARFMLKVRELVE